MRLERLRSNKLLRRAYSSASPRVQTLAREVYGFVSGRPAPYFFGWLMSTEHEHPWVDDHRWSTFRSTCEELKSFELTDLSRLDSLDSLRWRHWIVAYGVTHAIAHSSADTMTCLEAGVEDGLTAFVALRELERARDAGEIARFEFHLYDAWAAMGEENLSASERSHVGKYEDLDVRRTESNLSPFRNQITVHKGYLPGTLESSPPPEAAINYVHIDLNAAQPTVDVCNFVLPRLAPGSVVLFDDYGWRAYRETKEAVDDFFSDKPGSLLKFPTGQAIYFR